MLTDFEIALQLQWDEDDEMHVNSEVIARLLKEQETEMLNTATNEEIAILMQQDEVKAANDMVRSHQLAWQLQEEQAPPQSSSNEIWPGANSAVYQDVTRCHQMSHELAFNLFNPQNIQVETVYATSNHAHAEALRKQMERSDEANSDAIAKLIQQEEAEIAEARSLTLALQLHEEELRRRPTNDRERSTAPPHPYGRRPIHQHRVPTSQNSNNGTRSSSSRSLGFPAGGFPPRMRLLVSEFNQGHFVNNISNGESFFQGISPGVAGLMMSNRSEEQDDNDYEALLALAESLGSVNSGLTPCEAGMLPSQMCTAQSTPSGACNICLCDYSVGDEISTLPCVHAFHKNCIGKWLEQSATCPVCRSDVKITHN